MARLLAAILLSPLLILAVPGAASAEDCVSVGLDGVSADCAWTYAEYASAAAQGGGSVYEVVVRCDNAGICAEYVECVENGESGLIHDVLRDGVDVGDVCVPGREVGAANVARLVIREFKQNNWKASRLVVQPKGGRTLVNFRTNFYTPDNATLEKQVTIAGQDVVIHATPVSYTYVFGDGDSTSTPSPGGAYPTLDVTHEYAKTDTFEVRLDTTYAGEFRISDGEWTPIAETLTVVGPTQELEVLEALPQLVNR